MNGKRNSNASDNNVAKLAFRFVLIIGIVNLFADFTYEGARAIYGPFLGSLGASAAVVGFVAGFGELMGYGLRIISGYFGGKTQRYWVFAFAGYATNMFAVPALALAGNWPTAAALIVLERTGRALRRPNVEAMISHAGTPLGHGWVFGLNEALDQTGATIGPLVTAFILWKHGTYRHAFAVALIPALLCVTTVIIARFLYPRPHEFDKSTSTPHHGKQFSKPFWLYFAAAALIAAGFADFSSIAFHFQKHNVINAAVAPVFYSVAMASGAIASLAFGRLFDKIGIRALLLAFFASALFAPCVFAGGFALALIGMILWGIGMGAQDSLLKAAIARLVPPQGRSVSFGLFDAGFGVAWFIGSAAMGLLYEKSIVALIIFSVALQLFALPIFALAKRAE